MATRSMPGEPGLSETLAVFPRTTPAASVNVSAEEYCRNTEDLDALLDPHLFVSLSSIHRRSLLYWVCTSHRDSICLLSVLMAHRECIHTYLAMFCKLSILLLPVPAFGLGQLQVRRLK
jgi:hypothetical protein